MYETARELFATWGVDTEAALHELANQSISLHCWQGDDVAGCECRGEAIGGGLAVTGNYPGRARNGDELRDDLQVAIRLIPGRHRLNLHASYAETSPSHVERNELQVAHFSRWIDWAREHQCGLDFNSTFFAHPLAADGFTLAHRDNSIRNFWIEHGQVCRKIGAAMGDAVGTPCLHNVWIPDGFKDTPVDRWSPRERLCQALDLMFAESFSGSHLVDAVESKLFGLGSESYVVGSHEFYLGYAITRKKWLCLDSGHFHPTEGIADKFSSVLPWVPGILLHVSRGVRWDSDHVVTLSDDTLSIAREWACRPSGTNVRWGLDFFDASIHRIAAWVIGARSLLKALLIARLQPWEQLLAAEQVGDYTRRLAWQEETKSLPWGPVWDELCLRANVPPGARWYEFIQHHERDVIPQRVL